MRSEVEELIARAGGVENVMMWFAHPSGGSSAEVQHHIEHPWCAGTVNVVMGIERVEYEELLARGARDMGRQSTRVPRFWLHVNTMRCERCGSELEGRYTRDGRHRLSQAAPPARWGGGNADATTLIVPCPCGGAGSVGITHREAPARGE